MKTKLKTLVVAALCAFGLSAWADVTYIETEIGKDGPKVFALGPSGPEGSEGNPWDIGEGVTAYTNGTELVIGGEGTVADLSEIPDAVKDGIEEVTIKNPTVTGAADDAFAGLSEINLTLHGGWQGELPDEEGNWYGATGVELTAWPKTVKNVKFQQRYPWNGKVDIGFGVTGPVGEANVAVTVKDGETAVANFTATVTIPEGGILTTNLVWDEDAAGLAANFKSDAVTIEVAFVGGSAEPVAVQLWENGPYFATCNVGATEPEEAGYYFWWGDTVGYTHDGEKWVSVKDGATSIQFNNSAPANMLYNKDAAALSEYVDANGNLKSDYDAAWAHLGEPWRMMTKAELDSLVANCEVEWTDNWNETGIKGTIVKGKGDYSSNSIFLPAAGWGYESSLNDAGLLGFYWSSTPNSDDSIRAGGPSFNSDEFCGSYYYRYYGQSVRPVRDAAIAAKSAAGALDLTVGDRVAKDVETLIADPAWDESTTVTVFIDGEAGAREYTTASKDPWQTTSLEPGRYAMTLAGDECAYSAAFWKTGEDWVVFDGSNITENTTFEAGKTYLVLGTNMVNGKTLMVEDGAKFFYDEGAPAGFKAASVAELPKRYEIADGVDLADESKLFQIVEKPRGSEDNPWDVGEGVTAYTNGTELVISGEGTIADISEIPAAVKDGIDEVSVTDPTVTGAADDAFTGMEDIALTLPDGWQGELPDDDGSWYGAKNAVLTAYPLTVRNVKTVTYWPWNGKIDVTCDLTGAGKVELVVALMTNGVTVCEAMTLSGGTLIDLDDAGGATNGVMLVWNAKADCPTDFNAADATVVVTAGRQKTDGDYMVIDLSADGNGRFAVSYEDMDVASAIEKYNTDEYKTGKLVLKKIPAGTAYPCEPRMSADVTSTPISGTMTPAKDYFIGLFETTAAQCDRVMGVEAPSDATTPKNCISYNMIRGGDDSWDIEPTGPVAAESFMGILAAKTGVAGFDLPTEIQWEIAARAGSTAEYGSYLGEDGSAVAGVYNSSAAPWGNTTNFMWFAKNNNPAGVKSVGLLRPNLWGLYDTAGNVYEFCLDVYNEDKTSWDDVETPEADGDSYMRSLRGGYFAKAATVSRPSVRASGYSDSDGINIGAGFRLCRTVASAGSSTSATATSTSGAFAVDLREEIALAEGETLISGVSYSDTAWGAAAKTGVALGYVNETTGATGELATGLSESSVKEVNLPKKNGMYQLTHSTGGLISFVKFTVSGYPLGSENNPWLVGADDPADVVAVSNGTGTVSFQPVRGKVSKAGLETIASAMGGSDYPAKLVSADGSATNDVVMALGSDGKVYDTIAEVLAASPGPDTVRLYEVKLLALALSVGKWGAVSVDINDGETTLDIPAGTETNLDVLAGLKVVVTPQPNAGFTTFSTPVTIDAMSEPTTLPAFTYVPNPDATLRWKFCKGAGRYFGQIAVTAQPGYEEAISGFDFLFEDREQDGGIYALLWDISARAPVSATLANGGTTYRDAAVGTSPFDGKAAGERVVLGLSDKAYNSDPLRTPKGDEALISLYVLDRVSPVSGNETAGDPENFLCYLSWVTDGARYFLPMAEGAANGALAAAEPTVLRSALPPRKFSAAVSFGLPLVAASENAVEAEIVSFEVGPESVSGRVAVSAGTATSTTYVNGATVTIFGTATLGGTWSELSSASVNLTTGCFTIPASAVESSGAKFFKAVVMPSEKQIVE